MDLLTVLDDAGIPHKDRGTNVGRSHINICCPYCYEGRFHCGIHEEDGWFLCWVCGEKGQWRKLAFALKKQHSRLSWQDFKTGRASLFIEDLMGKIPRGLEDITRDFVTYDTDKIHEDDLEAWEYLLLERRLESELVRTIRPGIGMRGPNRGDPDLRGYITFRQGDQLIARSMYEDIEPRWWKSASGIDLWGMQWVQVASPEWVVITEGVFDAIAVPLGHGLAILGSISGDKWLGAIAQNLPESVKDICLALDPGVNKRTVTHIRLELGDLGFNVSVLNWSRDEFRELLSDESFDLDRLRLRMGRDFVLETVLRTTGVIDDDNRPLL